MSDKAKLAKLKAESDKAELAFCESLINLEKLAHQVEEL